MMVRKVIITIMCVWINTTIAFAQDPGFPCEGDDIDNPCELPLDTWVYVLVIAGVIFGAYKLHQKKRKLII
jgi:hypothetical protein